jgi:hypothetical protein
MRARPGNIVIGEEETKKRGRRPYGCPPTTGLAASSRSIGVEVDRIGAEGVGFSGIFRLPARKLVESHLRGSQPQVNCKSGEALVACQHI